MPSPPSLPLAPRMPEIQRVYLPFVRFRFVAFSFTVELSEVLPSLISIAGLLSILFLFP